MKMLTSSICILLFAAAVPARAEWVTRVTDGIMGTRITVELWSEDRPKAEEAIDAVLDEMRHIDESMSTYKPTSEVSLVNSKAADGPMHISKELFNLLVKAKEYSVITDGAFDITYASVGYLYDFPSAYPARRDANRARRCPRSTIAMSPRSEGTHGALRPTGVRIDLGGIAKGYAVDRGIESCKARGITHAIVTPAATAASSATASASPG